MCIAHSNDHPRIKVIAPSESKQECLLCFEKRGDLLYDCAANNGTGQW